MCLAANLLAGTREVVVHPRSSKTSLSLKIAAGAMAVYAGAKATTSRSVSLRTPEN
jgi:hypothetical protein